MTSLILPVGILKDSKRYGHFKHLQHTVIDALQSLFGIDLIAGSSKALPEQHTHLSFA